MKDLLRREINYLRISVTDLCNLRCQYCMPEEGIEKKRHSQIISIEEIEEIVTAAAKLGINKVRLTGGEPLIRNGILEICSRIGKIPGIKDIGVTTNGLLLEDMAAGLKAAGVNRINISLDTLRNDRYQKITRHGDISKVFRGIDAAKKEGLFPIKINAVLIGGVNDDEIPDFIKLTMDEEIEVRFIELMRIGQTSSWPAERFIKGEEVLRGMPELIPVIGEHGVAKIYKLPGAKGTVGLIMPMSNHFCKTCNKIRVTADGKLKPCLHSDSEINLKGLTGDALSQVLQNGINAKPQQHSMDYKIPSLSHRSMFQIGG